MTLISVDPPSVLEYAQAAQRSLDAISDCLSRITATMRDAPYGGRNADRFRVEGSTMAREYESQMGIQMAQIADAVNRATSAISMSLGGEEVSLRVALAGNKAEQLTERGGSLQTIDVQGMAVVPSQLEAEFSSVSAQLDSHLGQLEATVWTGEAKRRCVTMVQEITSQARTTTETNRDGLIDFVGSQIDATTSADAATFSAA